jgi:hypothetical protein
LDIIDLENGFEFPEIGFLKRITIQIMSAFWFVFIVFIMIMATVGWRNGLILFTYIYLINILINGYWLRYHLKKIVFYEKEISIVYYYFNRKIERVYSYQGFQIDKGRNEMIVTFLGKKIMAQHILGNLFNGKLIDMIISRFYKYKVKSMVV